MIIEKLTKNPRGRLKTKIDILKMGGGCVNLFWKRKITIMNQSTQRSLLYADDHSLTTHHGQNEGRTKTLTNRS